MRNKSNVNQISPVQNVSMQFQGTLNCTSKAKETDHEFPKQSVNLCALPDLIIYFTWLCCKEKLTFINKQIEVATIAQRS